MTSNTYRVNTTRMEKWSESLPQSDETAVVPYRVELATGPITVPLYVKGKLNFATLAVDTDTTLAPSDIVVDLTIVELLSEWADADREVGNVELAKSRELKAQAIAQKLVPRILQFSKPRGRVQGTLR